MSDLSSKIKVKVEAEAATAESGLSGLFALSYACLGLGLQLLK